MIESAPSPDQIADYVDPRVLRVCHAVRESGGRAMIVGGFVRDWMRGHPSKDVDVEVSLPGGKTGGRALKQVVGKIQAGKRQARLTGEMINHTVAPPGRLRGHITHQAAPLVGNNLLPGLAVEVDTGIVRQQVSQALQKHGFAGA